MQQLAKKSQMRKKGMIDIRAALKLIAAEDMNALRGVRRSIAGRIAKYADMQKKV